MARILYLAELFKKTGWEPILCTTPNNYDRVNNIYYFDITRDNSSYWVSTWGGFFDTVDNTNIQILLGQFLLKVSSSAILEATVNSFYIDGNLVYVHTAIKPWQYYKVAAEVSTSDGVSFSSGVKDSKNPSDVKYDGRKFLPRLMVPKVKNKLSDPISGLSLFANFTYSILNNDGLYDDLEENNFSNTPTVIYKSASKDAPDFSDFNIIRRGLVDFVSVDYDKFSVTVADYNKFFTDEITRVFTTDEFPNIESSVENKNIPIGYGTLYKIPLVQVDKDTAGTPTWIDYVAIEPSQVDSVAAIYDENGDSLTFTVSNGIIRATQLDGGGEVIPAQNADLEGKQGYVLGSIITELINDFSTFKYLEGNWDVTETNTYIALSAEVGFYFAGGQLKDAVNKLLENDNAFVFTKNDGRLSIRQWGQSYNTHDIPSWQIINPRKIRKNTNFQSKYYISTSRINYQRQEDFDNYGLTYINESQQLETLDKFRRSKTGNYDTILINQSDVIDLSERLLNRFANMNALVSIDVTFDTTSINLLDRVNMEIETNDRLFSGFSGWIVREVDPGQDSLLLEAIPGTEVAKAILDNNDLAILDNEGKAILGS